MSYRTFLRSCKNWQEFASARKVTQERGLTYNEARAACEDYNENRTSRQIAKGTKMEFEEE
jgi:hypothetical protein